MSENQSGEPDGPVTFINVFEIPSAQVEAFVAGWRERARLMSTAPGFRDAELHQAVSAETRFQLVNVAHWESRQAWEAATANPDFQDAIRTISADPQQQVRPNTGLYRTAARVD